MLCKSIIKGGGLRRILDLTFGRFIAIDFHSMLVLLFLTPTCNTYLFEQLLSFFKTQLVVLTYYKRKLLTFELLVIATLLMTPQ